jgi:hypothetical protein
MFQLAGVLLLYARGKYGHLALTSDRLLPYKRSRLQGRRPFYIHASNKLQVGCSASGILNPRRDTSARPRCPHEAFSSGQREKARVRTRVEGTGHRQEEHNVADRCFGRGGVASKVQTSSKNRGTRGRLLLPPDLCLFPGLITTSTGNPRSEPRHF